MPALADLGLRCSNVLALADKESPPLDVLAILVDALALVRAASALPLDAVPVAPSAPGNTAAKLSTVDAPITHPTRPATPTLTPSCQGPPVDAATSTVRRGLLLAAFWRAVQPAVVGRAALACGMHEAALLFLELSETQRAAAPVVSARAARGNGRGTPSFEHRPVLAHTDLFRRVFTGLRDADALHGLQSDTSTDMLVCRVRPRPQRAPRGPALTPVVHTHLYCRPAS